MKTLVGVLVAVGVILFQLYQKIILGLIKLLTMMVTARIHFARYTKKKWTFTDEFERKVDANPHLVQFILAETGEKRTLKEIDVVANQVAHWAESKGCTQKNNAALMLLNNLDYVSIWVGLSKIGVSTALLNTNIAGKAFLHSVETSLKDSETKLLIIDSQLKIPLKNELEELQSKGILVEVWGEKATMSAIETQPSSRPDQRLRESIRENDPLIFIFTSGTTGLPKACKISHSRYWLGGLPVAVLAELKAGDVIYTAMPLYHSAAGLMAVGGAVRSGATLVIRKKFSASNFSKDCLTYGVKAVQYIGELCRYLVNLPANEEVDSQLKIRCAFGNGMRREYWEKFQQRYRVQHVVEFYGATEGNVALFNCFDKVGPLGYVPRFLDFLYPLKLIKTEAADQSVPLRNAQGRCELCAANEPGLLIAEISADRRFEGYTDANATKAKIFRDVFRVGDAYFNTGDLLSRDEEGFFYWSDRIGDTFRWKGENVSTTEVSEVLSACGGVVEDCVVYGVEVPNTDGRAGMAAIVLKKRGGEGGEEEDWREAVSREVAKHLPVYARPLFLRIKSEGSKLPVTATHKYVKIDLVKEGFDPKRVGDDELYLLDGKTGKYEKLTEEIHDQIANGALRL